MKIAFVTSEAVPFAKTGGMADVCGALPLELEKLSQEVVLIMPKYQSVRLSGALIKFFDDDFDVATIGEGVKAYFLKHDMYLREGLYGDRLGDYPDNLRRFSYFCQKALELFGRIGFYPDIIHCHDWQTSLIPLFLKAHGRDYFPQKKGLPKTLLTIHNISYQGIFRKEELPQTGLDWEYFTLGGLEYYDNINLLKGGILFSDCINTVSANHAREIQTKEFGCGLEGVLATRRDRFFGIANGVDYTIWNPQGDPAIFKNYSLANIQDKKVNKRRLQQTCGLARDENMLLLGFVGRLVTQKGVDLLVKILPKLCKANIQTVILGMGDPQIENALLEIGRQYPSFVFSSSHFDDELAHRIYAASDVFLMPSRFEPCGIGQLISFKYGTVPIVYKTGGLADTVSDYNLKDNTGSGFVFTKYDEAEFFLAIQRAREVFSDKRRWQSLSTRLMRLNFSWKESAKKYAGLYEEVRSL